MAFFEDILKGGNLTTGLAIGVGMAVLTPIVLPVLRPVAKSVIKAGLIAYDEGRAAVSAVSHEAEEAVAEARSEMTSKDSRSRGQSTEKSLSAPAVKRTRQS